MFLFRISGGQSNDIMTYDGIIKGIDKQLQFESEIEDKGQLFLFRDITDHWTITGSSSSYEVLVNWYDRHATLETISVIRYDPPF